MTLRDFFIKHQCTPEEQEALVRRLVQLRGMKLYRRLRRHLSKRDYIHL